jgi:SAM-dependent methyltransferase
MLGTVYRLLETAQGYSISQVLGFPTLRRYRALVLKHVVQDASRRVLEIGCGVGSARQLFASNYTGIDINADYINRARRNFSGRFCVVDAAQMPFGPNAFDDAICIATTHHLTDEQLSAMIRKGTDVASCLHIVDAILPLSASSWFKNALFRMDRGRYARTLDRLREIVILNSRLEFCEAVKGPLHDVCYIRLSRLNQMDDPQ